VLNALTIDLEFWWCSELLSNIEPDKENDFLEEMTGPFLDLLEKSGTKTTFFVLGQVAEKHPDLVKRIQAAGHEIASHGYSHTMIGKLGRRGFRSDLEKSMAVLKSITGERPVGYRAPSFSLNKGTAWALETLEDMGFKYDSSIFPVSRRIVSLYGVPDAPLTPYRPAKDDITKTAKCGIMEFPLNVYRLLGVNLPVAGGFYLRVLPLGLLKKGIRKANGEGRPAIMYVHPWEAFRDTPKRESSLGARFRRRYGMDSVLGKLEALLKSFEFGRIREMLPE